MPRARGKRLSSVKEKIDEPRKARLKASIVATVRLRPGLHQSSVAVIMGYTPSGNGAVNATVRAFINELSAAGLVQLQEEPSRSSGVFYKLYPIATEQKEVA